MFKRIIEKAENLGRYLKTIKKYNTVTIKTQNPSLHPGYRGIY